MTCTAEACTSLMPSATSGASKTTARPYGPASTPSGDHDVVRPFMAIAKAGRLTRKTRVAAVPVPAHTLDGPTGAALRERATSTPAVGRSFVVAMQETVSLVLDEGSPVPETDQDVRDLVLRLRGHLAQLGPALDSPARPLAEALDEARALAGDELPEGFMPSRVYLRALALRVQAVVEELLRPRPATAEAVRTPDAPPALPDVVECVPDRAEIEREAAASVPWLRRCWSTGGQSSNPARVERGSRHRVSVLAAALVAVVLRWIRRLGPLRPQPMQRLVALDESRFIQVCRQSSAVRGGAQR
ncbi:DUF6415 family natural product biosynthesis protein [Streptomyces sp. NPDC058284]|uniref:DUF6415 family natural product biosynthesis protein n=1 Tax=unclassified Streptomyces TaxID=2593676 RepID=UPI0036634606